MISLDRNSRVSLYIQIYTGLKIEIVQGILKENEILPGSRSFAALLHVSRNTVETAYSQLTDEGYIQPDRGVGCRVLKVPVLPADGRPLSVPCSYSPASVVKEPAAVLYDLTNSSHSNDLFPRHIWKKYTLESLERLHAESKLSLQLDHQGEFFLRHNLRLYLERIRGVSCTEGQIVITCGLQQSLDFLCKILKNGRRTIIMEDPGYNKAAAVFAANELLLDRVPVDENGLVVSALPVNSDICALYCTPSHQFPTGVILPAGRRVELLSWARSANAYILEDDYDSEQRYYARPIPSLQSMDSDQRVIYLGTFSKALSPSIRMAYMILPPSLAAAWQQRFLNYNSTVPLLNQYVIGRLIETGEYDRHIRRLNGIFRKRLECFMTGFADIQHAVKISGNGSGQYFLLKFAADVLQSVLIARALDAGVKVYSTMQFWQDKADCPPDTLFLGFSKIDHALIPDCVKRLKSAWREWITVDDVSA
jgi:GntR family transcriptional regulator / MocR family aminotransferase